MREHIGNYLLNLSLLFLGTGVLGGLFSGVDAALKVGITGFSFILFLVFLVMGFATLHQKDQKDV
ncbi:MAG: hypothetical protein MI755_19845 [Sphingomonadales bacterium]|nr:hypothetical protein [Sphingomonadales bacterium]